MTLSARILEACKVSAGLSLSELSEAVGDTADFVNSMAGLLYRQERLHRAGVRKFYRYFTNPADAAAWELIAEDIYRAHKKEMGRLKRQRKAERAKAGVDFKPPAPKPPKPPKKKKRVELVLQREVAKAEPKPARIIWPETVKVQVHPTPPSRFAFEPPEGWKGQISMDQMERRLSAVQGSAQC